MRNKKEGGLDKVFIHQDWTPKEREARRIVVKELMDKKAKGEKDLIIVNGKIVLKWSHKE